MFGPKRLGDILASFQKTIDDLKSLETANTLEVVKNDNEILRLNDENVELRTEAEKASIVRGKVENLISA